VATKTKIVIGPVRDNATSAEVAVLNEGFTAKLGVPVLLQHKNLQATSYEVRSSTTYTATSNGAADGTTIINTSHTQANDYWNGYTVKMLTGTCAGETCVVDDFDAATDKLILAGVGFSAQIDTGDTYTFLFVDTTDYTVDLANGAVTAIAGQDMFNLETYLIDYHFNENNLAYKIQAAIDAEGSAHQVYVTHMGHMGVALIVYTP
jgi:hypothetical protein